MLQCRERESSRTVVLSLWIAKVTFGSPKPDLKLIWVANCFPLNVGRYLPNVENRYSIDSNNFVLISDLKFLDKVLKF